MSLARRFVIMATTDTILTIALLTATTVLTGSPAECLSALARGMAGAVVGAGVAVGVTATTVEAAGDTATGGVVEATTDTLLMADAAMVVAASAEVADSVVQRVEVTTVAADSMAEVAVASTEVVAASTVAAGVTVAVADTGNPGR